MKINLTIIKTLVSNLLNLADNPGHLYSAYIFKEHFLYGGANVAFGN